MTTLYGNGRVLAITTAPSGMWCVAADADNVHEIPGRGFGKVMFHSRAVYLALVTALAPSQYPEDDTWVEIRDADGDALDTINYGASFGVCSEATESDAFCEGHFTAVDREGYERARDSRPT